MRRQAIEEELQRNAVADRPASRPRRGALEGFERFCDTEPEPAERRKLLAELFQAIWQKDGQIVAVKPQPPLAPYFTALRAEDEHDPKARPDS